MKSSKKKKKQLNNFLRNTFQAYIILLKSEPW